uniref:Uncharacterized protein n=1 Tax=viral metagenome TaxID=1070528 RepID=A0A6C0D8R2_9ZZZZ
MVKAEDLINNQKERDKIKFKTFEKIFNSIEKKITLASASNFYYVWYEIPEFIIGFPLYNLKECTQFVIKKLKKNGFKIEEFEPNIILIEWFPQDK